MGFKYQCCFCGKTIEDTLSDPAGLLYIANINKPSESQVSQQFYCHTTCLEKYLHNSTHLYLLDLIKD